MAPRLLSPSTRSTKLLVVALRRHIRQSGKSLRTLESELAWGHGTLGNALRGRTEIRLHHVEGIAKALDLRTIDLLREVYDDNTGGVVAVTLTEERLTTLIREAVITALETSPADRSHLEPTQRLDLNEWLTSHEPDGWAGIKTAFRSGAKTCLAGGDPTSTNYREGDRFIEHFRSGFDAMNRALQSGSVFACPSCGQPLRGEASLSVAK